MIKVVGKKVEEPKIYRTVCFECEAMLEYEEGDTYIGALGGRELVCPSCGEKTFVDEPEGIDLDSSNIEFPTHFMYTSNRAVNIKDDEIQGWVRRCLKKIEDNPEDEFHLTGSGDTVVIALNFGDEYDIYVAKKYWECSIPKE